MQLFLICFQVFAGLCFLVGEAPVKDSPGDELFDGDQVWNIEMVIGEKEMAVLQEYHWGRYNTGQERVDVPVIVREGGNTYTNVAVHLKGSAGSFQSIHSRPALTLKFGKFQKGQRFYGLKKIHLNNSRQDPTLLHEKISRELFQKAGIPVPRSSHARFKLNGRDLGMYVLVEGFNEQFLKRHFREPGGNLYDGGFVQDIDQSLDRNSGDYPNDRSDLQALVSASRDSDLKRRWLRMENLLDVKQFAIFMAMEVFLWHWDGYCMNHNNYRLYQNPENGLFVFLPHGMDQMFRRPDGPLEPAMKGMIARAFMQTRQGRVLYLQTASELMNQVFNADRISSRLKEIAAAILPSLNTIDPGYSRFLNQVVDSLISSVIQRSVALSKELRNPLKEPRFLSGGIAQLDGWESNVLYGYTAATKAPHPGAQGQTLILSAQGPSAGNWQTRVLLDPGKYRFEGRLKTSEVTRNPRSPVNGAGLVVTLQSRSNRRRYRSSGTSRSQSPRMLLSGNWAATSVTFQIHQPATAVNLSCELVAVSGEAWFDADAARLVRLSD